jgi:Na+/melibiose symporter-like transporter
MAIGFAANTTPTLQVVDGIHTIMTLVPAAGYLLTSIIFYFGYRIDDIHVLRMHEEIGAQKAWTATDRPNPTKF